MYSYNSSVKLIVQLYFILIGPELSRLSPAHNAAYWSTVIKVTHSATLTIKL